MSAEADPLYGERMNDQDALMLSIERDPLLRSTMVGLMTFDRAPDPERFERALSNLVRAMPRLRQVAAPDAISLAPPRWEPDPYFDLDFHVARVSVTGEDPRRELLDLASKLAMDSFDMARPLWRLVLVEGLDEGRAAMILKLHHSVTDAVGFFRVLGNLVQAGPDDPIPEVDEVPAGSRLSGTRRLADAAAYRLREAAELLADLARRVLAGVPRLISEPGAALGTARRLPGSLWRVFRPEFAPKSPLMRERSLNTRLDVVSLPFEELRAAAKGAGGTLNDAFLAGLAGALARYHARNGVELHELRVNMPINLRGEGGGEGGNYFVPARFVLPVGTPDPIREAGEIVTRLRAEPGLARFGSVTRTLNRAPALARPLFGTMLKSVDVNASNVPGPPMALFCAGAEIEEMLPATPLAGAAVSVALLSYRGRVQLTIQTDTAAVPDGGLLRECIEEGFEELLEGAPQPALDRVG